MSKTDTEQLLEYGVELGLSDPTSLTLSRLIVSHRTLRSDVDLVSEREVWKAEVKAAADKAYNAAHDSTWVKWSDLKRMSLADILEKINFDSELQ